MGSFYNQTQNTDVEIAVHTANDAIVDGDTYIINLIRAQVSPSMCEKIYRRTYVVETFIPLPMGISMGEDLLQGVLLASKCKKVKYFYDDSIEYRVTDNPFSVSHRFDHSYEYEKYYYGIWSQLCNHKSLDINRALFLSKVNGLALVIMANNHINYDDCYFRSLLLEKQTLRYKSLEAWLIFYVRNTMLCKWLIKTKRLSYDKSKQIISQIRNR